MQNLIGWLRHRCEQGGVVLGSLRVERIEPVVELLEMLTHYCCDHSDPSLIQPLNDCTSQPFSIGKYQPALCSICDLCRSERFQGWCALPDRLVEPAG